MTRRATGRDRPERRRRPRRLAGCGGAAILMALGSYLAYLFIYASGTAISVLVGLAFLALTAYLTWDYLRRSRDPGA